MKFPNFYRCISIQFSYCLQKTFLRVVFINLCCLCGQVNCILIFFPSFFIRVDRPNIPRCYFYFLVPIFFLGGGTSSNFFEMIETLGKLEVREKRIVLLFCFGFVFSFVFIFYFLCICLFFPRSPFSASVRLFLSSLSERRGLIQTFSFKFVYIH